MSTTPRLCIVLFFLNGAAMNVRVLFPQYTSIVLGWSLANVNAMLALEGALSWLVLLSLPFFRRAFLAPHMTVANTDIAIVQGSLGANIMGMIGLGLSASKIPYIAAISVYTSGSGLADSLRTYATLGLSPMEQVSDLYVRFSLTETLAGLLGPPLWTGLFGSVLKGGYLPVGLPFWICAAVFAGALTLTWSIKRLEDDL